MADCTVSSTVSKDSFYDAEVSNFPEVSWIDFIHFSCTTVRILIYFWLNLQLQPDVLVRSLLEQIKMFSEFAMLKSDERDHFQSLLNRLANAMAIFEQAYKKQFAEMKEAQDSSFAQIFIEKNDELIKLRSEMENLNKLKKVGGSLELKDELSAAKMEVRRLNGIVQQRNDEINRLTYKLLDAQSCIESLEKSEKLSQVTEWSELHANAQLASEHFKTIKQALLANRNLLKTIQLKKQMQWFYLQCNIRSGRNSIQNFLIRRNNWNTLICCPIWMQWETPKRTIFT